jgi:hypothetical protein
VHTRVAGCFLKPCKKLTIFIDYEESKMPSQLEENRVKYLPWNTTTH